MKTFHLLILILVSLAGFGQSRIKPSGLMIEFIREPEGVQIMDLKPEFTWIVPAKAKTQTAFRILIASTPDKIRDSDSDVWDSGMKESDRSVEVECDITLNPNSLYYWKVMIWDLNGKPSDFSEIQRFTTGKPGCYATTSNKFQSQLKPPELIVKTQDGYFADFGKDAFGTLLLDIPSGQTDTLIIHLGEKLSAENTIDRYPGGTIRYTRVLLSPPLPPGEGAGGEAIAITLPLQKDTRNTGPTAVKLPDSLGVITPFRYCEVENFTGDLSSSHLKQLSYHYHFSDDLSSFYSRDSVLDAVWDICKYSMKATSFAGIYVDGDRERIPYEADAYINQLGHYYTDREYSLARRTNEYFIDHPTWPTEWILHTVPMFWNDMMFTGNIESFENFYNALKSKTLISLAGPDGLISAKNATPEIMISLGFSNENEQLRDIVDWPPAQKDTGWELATSEGERDGYDMREVNTVVNAFYFNSLKLMADLATHAGMHEDAGFYSTEAMKVKRVFNEKLLNKNNRIYVDGIGSDHSSLHANMMALAFGLVPEEHKKTVIDFIKSRGMACSVYGAQYLLAGLYRAGEADYALELMTATHDRSWWNMIKAGSTITLEAWDMKYKPNSDWNHAWGAAPANIIPGYMWGISPAEPGWKKAVIKPQLSKLSQSKVMVPTIRGNINAEYIRKGRGGRYKITIPGNMECDFITPTESLKLIPGVNKITVKN